MCWTEAHLERGARILVSVGGWGGSTSPRRSVGIECRMGVDRPGFMVVDAATLPWGNEEYLGTKLTREEALADPTTKEIFAFLDVLITADPRFNAFLMASPRGR